MAHKNVHYYYYDNSTWHAMNTGYIYIYISTKETFSPLNKGDNNCNGMLKKPLYYSPSTRKTIAGSALTITMIIIMEFIFVVLVQLQQEPQVHYNSNNR